MNSVRKRRVLWIGLMLGGVAVSAAFALSAFNQNLMFFYAPAAVVAGAAPPNHPFRLGGLVSAGSLVRQTDGLTVRFAVTDQVQTVTIEYTGILPDLFREGQGIVARGRLRDDGVFVADEVLAKHDENYMPPEVAAALKTARQDMPAAPEAGPP